MRVWKRKFVDIDSLYNFLPARQKSWKTRLASVAFLCGVYVLANGHVIY